MQRVCLISFLILFLGYSQADYLPFVILRRNRASIPSPLYLGNDAPLLFFPAQPTQVLGCPENQTAYDLVAYLFLSGSPLPFEPKVPELVIHQCQQRESNSFKRWNLRFPNLVGT